MDRAFRLILNGNYIVTMGAIIMATGKRGRPADRIVKLGDVNYKVEPNAFLGTLRQMSNGTSAKDALENVGARTIVIGDTVDFSDLDDTGAKQMYERLLKESAADEE